MRQNSLHCSNVQWYERSSIRASTDYRGVWVALLLMYGSVAFTVSEIVHASELQSQTCHLEHRSVGSCSLPSSWKLVSFIQTFWANSNWRSWRRSQRPQFRAQRRPQAHLQAKAGRMPPSAGSSSVAEYSRRHHAGSSDEYAESRETHIGIHTGRLGLWV